MKFCTRYEVIDGEPGRALDVILVSDTHHFGLTPDGRELHAEGGRAVISPAPRPGLACAVCGATEDLVVHHTDADPLNNDPRSLQVVCPEHIPRED